MVVELAATRDANDAKIHVSPDRVFVSYAGADRAIAERVRVSRPRVPKCGGTRRMGWGDNWIETLQRNLTECTAYVILVGASGARRWVKAELLIATRRHFENDLPVFPLLLHGVPPDNLPPFLSTIQAASLPEIVEFSSASWPSAWCEFRAARRMHNRSSTTASVRSRASRPSARTRPGSSSAAQSETLDALRRLGPGLDGIYRRWLQIEGPSRAWASRPWCGRGWCPRSDVAGSRRGRSNSSLARGAAAASRRRSDREPRGQPE